MSGAEKTPLMRAIQHYGVPVPTSVLHAVNSLSPRAFREMQERARRRRIADMAEQQRRVREDMRALQSEAEAWRW